MLAWYIAALTCLWHGWTILLPMSASKRNCASEQHFRSPVGGGHLSSQFVNMSRCVLSLDS